jgi:hypothetical protein
VRCRAYLVINMQWIKVADRLPHQSDILMVKLDDDTKCKAYFYPDQIAWAAFYGAQISYWYHQATKKPLFNVTEWQEKEIKS